MIDRYLLGRLGVAVGVSAAEAAIERAKAQSGVSSSMAPDVAPPASQISRNAGRRFQPRDALNLAPFKDNK